MQFRNLKVIEDKSNLFNAKIYVKTDEKTGELIVQDDNVFNEPMSIQDAEFYEERLEAAGIPYVLVQVEVTLKEPGNYRYSRGYVILTDGAVSMTDFFGGTSGKDVSPTDESSDDYLLDLDTPISSTVH